MLGQKPPKLILSHGGHRELQSYKMAKIEGWVFLKKPKETGSG